MTHHQDDPLDSETGSIQSLDNLLQVLRWTSQDPRVPRTANPTFRIEKEESQPKEQKGSLLPGYRVSIDHW